MMTRGTKLFRTLKLTGANLRQQPLLLRPSRRRPYCPTASRTRYKPSLRPCTNCMAVLMRPGRRQRVRRQSVQNTMPRPVRFFRVLRSSLFEPMAASMRRGFDSTTFDSPASPTPRRDTLEAQFARRGSRTGDADAKKPRRKSVQAQPAARTTVGRAVLKNSVQIDHWGILYPAH